MKPVPFHWPYILQGVAHWVAYKRVYFFEHLLPEGAVVAELNQLISAKIKGNQKVCCETMYKEITPQIKDQTRADIVIKNVNMDSGETEFLEVIEVKRLENKSDIGEIKKDFEKLARIKSNSDIRLFQIIVSQKKLSSWLFTEHGNLKRRDIYLENSKIEVKARIAKKAYESKAASANGVFVVLVEVSS